MNTILTDAKELKLEELEEKLNEIKAKIGISSKPDSGFLKKELKELLKGRTISSMVATEIREFFLIDCKMAIGNFNSIMTTMRKYNELGFDAEEFSELVDNIIKKLNVKIDLNNNITTNRKDIQTVSDLSMLVSNINQKYFNSRFNRAGINESLYKAKKDIKLNRMIEIYKNIECIKEDNETSFAEELFSGNLEDKEIDFENEAVEGKEIEVGSLKQKAEKDFDKLVDSILPDNYDNQLFFDVKITLKQTMYQIKKALYNRINNITIDRKLTIIPVFISTQHGTGKSTFIEKLCSPFEDALFQTQISDMLDERTYDIFAENLVGIMNEIKKVNDTDSLKEFITTSVLRRRELSKHDHVFIPHVANYLATSNKFGQCANDKTGNRRFKEIGVRSPIKLDVFNEIDMTNIWRSIDIEESPLLAQGTEYFNYYLTQQNNELRQQNNFDYFMEDIIETGEWNEEIFNREDLSIMELFKKYYNPWQQRRNNVNYEINSAKFKIYVNYSVVARSDIYEIIEKNNNKFIKIKLKPNGKNFDPVSNF